MVLSALLRAEWSAGVLGLRLYMACVAVAALMLGSVWMMGNALTQALEDNGVVLLGGDVAVTVVNAPLEDALVEDLAALGRLSRVVELRTSASHGGNRLPVEVKAVDDAYPLAGRVVLTGTASLEEALGRRDGRPGVVVEPALLTRLDAAVGDTLALGQTTFTIRATLVTEPDRLSSGRFLIGPRVLMAREHLAATGLTARGSLTDFRYRLRAPEGAGDTIAARVEALTPERGWELETPRDAGDRVRRTVERTTTFLGVAGIVALTIGLAGAWAAAATWMSRRSRTVALYRLSGATPKLVVQLHAAIMALAGVVGLGAGLLLAGGIASALMAVIAERLHLPWSPVSLFVPAAEVAATLALGLIGASTATLSAAGRLSPGAAMRSGDAPLHPAPRHVAWGGLIIALAVALAVLSLPMPGLAAVAALGLAGVAGLLGLGGWVLARLAARRRPRGFIGLVARQGLAASGAAATKAVAIGIGIAGITAIVAAQNSLEDALLAELPAKIPDLVLIDVQPDQVEAWRARIEGDDRLGDLQASPFMRTTIRAVNGVPATEALVRPEKSWVIEGDRSFSWAAAPTGAELLAGDWWAEDYAGPPLISAEEDVQEAFDLKPGDELTYSVLGRTFTSTVANIRKEYHRSFEPEFLLVASPQPFSAAPHSWIMSLEGETDAAVDALIRDLAQRAPNVTAIDVRRIIAQVRQVLNGAILASLVVAATLLIVGALALTAVVAADVDARRREALAFTLVGASRREIALARLGEAVVVGALAAILGGGAGWLGGWWLVDEGLRVAWAPGWGAALLPLALGTLAALAAGAAGGLGALPRGRGEVARHLAN